MAGTKEKNPTQINQSTEKALAIIELLARRHAPMRLQDISNELKINVSTVLRFLNSLQGAGYVEQEESSQQYFLTYKICYLANLISGSMELPRITHPFLSQLTAEFHETTCISIEQDRAMVYVDIATDTSQSLMSVQRIGRVAPMHCTGNGKLLLMNYSEERLEEYVRDVGLTQFTPHTITTLERLRTELSQIRENGFAYDNEECELGIRCIACPLRNYTGKIVAGLSVTGPAGRMTEEKLAYIRPILQETCMHISRKMGFQ